MTDRIECDHCDEGLAELRQIMRDYGVYEITCAACFAQAREPGECDFTDYELAQGAMTDRPNHLARDDVATETPSHQFACPGDMMAVAGGVCESPDPRDEVIARLVEAVEELNAACDAMWNDHQRLEKNSGYFADMQPYQIKEVHMRAISEAQQALPEALTAAKAVLK